MPSERPYGFVKAIEFTLPWETGRDKNGARRADGGLHYRDGGLPTKYGIWKGANPEVDVENLTVEQAIDIYKAEYWDKYKVLRPVSANLDNLPAAIAVVVFDYGVNSGLGIAIKALGKGLETKNPTKTINDLRRAYDQGLADKNPAKYGPSIKGWLARINDLQKFADVLEQEAQDQATLLEKLKAAGKILGYGPSS